jgi:hypothetical protein
MRALSTGKQCLVATISVHINISYDTETITTKAALEHRQRLMGWPFNAALTRAMLNTLISDQNVLLCTGWSPVVCHPLVGWQDHHAGLLPLLHPPDFRCQPLGHISVRQFGNASHMRSEYHIGVLKHWVIGVQGLLPRHIKAQAANRAIIQPLQERRTISLRPNVVGTQPCQHQCPVPSQLSELVWKRHIRAMQVGGPPCGRLRSPGDRRAPR